MILFIDEGISLGLAMISYRYSRAKATGMENCDASKRNTYIMYLNTNNLYGWAMSKALTTFNFKWLTDKDIF